jgi:hypothetical protein
MRLYVPCDFCDIFSNSCCLFIDQIVYIILLKECFIYLVYKVTIELCLWCISKILNRNIMQDISLYSLFKTHSVLFICDIFAYFFLQFKVWYLFIYYFRCHFYTVHLLWYWLYWKICYVKGSSWSYGSWIYNYLCNQCLPPLTLWVQILHRQGVLDTTLCDKVCQWLATGRWFSLGTPVSSTKKNEIWLKMALNTINPNLIHINPIGFVSSLVILKSGYTEEISLIILKRFHWLYWRDFIGYTEEISLVILKRFHWLYWRDFMSP